jgi:hypothetical protein
MSSSYVWYIDRSIRADTREELRQRMLEAADKIWDAEVEDQAMELIRETDRPKSAFARVSAEAMELWKKNIGDGFDRGRNPLVSDALGKYLIGGKAWPEHNF